MAGLQRSATSFRRQGSSGLIWDDKLLSGELNQLNQKEDHDDNKARDEQGEQAKEAKPSRATDVGSINAIERSRSNGGGRAFRTGKVSPAIEPPSPRLSACGFCSAFGKKKDKPVAGRGPASVGHDTPSLRRRRRRRQHP